MTDAGPPPRFEIGWVLAATGQTLVRQWRAVALACLFGCVIPASLATQYGFALAWLRGPLSRILHPVLWWWLDDQAAYWLLWLAWAFKILLWAVVGVIGVAPLVWVTLNDHRRRDITLGGMLAMLKRTFWVLLLLELLFDIRSWGRPLGALLPFSNAWILADLILRLAMLLLVAWFGVATSAAIEEGGGFRRALARSAFLTKGRRLIIGGLTAGIDLAIEASWKPIHALVQPLNIHPSVLQSGASYVLFTLAWAPAIVFGTVLYLEMRRLRDPFPPVEGAAA